MGGIVLAPFLLAAFMGGFSSGLAGFGPWCGPRQRNSWYHRRKFIARFARAVRRGSTSFSDNTRHGEPRYLMNVYNQSNPGANRDAFVDAMMRYEAAGLNFEEEMRPVLVSAGLFFLAILLINAIADEPIVSFADIITGYI